MKYWYALNHAGLRYMYSIFGTERCLFPHAAIAAHFGEAIFASLILQAFFHTPKPAVIYVRLPRDKTD